MSVVKRMFDSDWFLWITGTVAVVCSAAVLGITLFGGPTCTRLRSAGKTAYTVDRLDGWYERGGERWRCENGEIVEVRRVGE